MIELRIPWGLLLVSDPSRQQVFAGTDQQWTPLSRATPGVSVAAFQVAVTANGGSRQKAVLSSLPLMRELQLTGPVPVYAWKQWNEVEFRPYFRQSYFALQKKFAEITGTSRGPRTAASGAR